MKATFRVSRVQLLALSLGLILLVVLVPIGVQATASNVVIADSSNPSSLAHVAGGRLYVDVVGGPVLTVPGRPFGDFGGTPIHTFSEAFKYPASLLLSGPSGTTGIRRTVYDVASFTVANETSAPAVVDILAVFRSVSSSACPVAVATSPRTPMTEVVVQPGQTLHTTYPEAMQDTVGGAGCLFALVTGPSEGVVAVTVEGYYRI